MMMDIQGMQLQVFLLGSVGGGSVGTSLRSLQVTLAAYCTIADILKILQTSLFSGD